MGRLALNLRAYSISKAGIFNEHFRLFYFILSLKVVPVVGGVTDNDGG